MKIEKIFQQALTNAANTVGGFVRLADLSGVGRSTLSEYVSPKAIGLEMKAKTVAKIMAVLEDDHFPGDWTKKRYFEEIQRSGAVPEPSADVAGPLSDDESTIVRHYRQLSRSGKAIIIKTIIDEARRELTSSERRMIRTLGLSMDEMVAEESQSYGGEKK